MWRNSDTKHIDSIAGFTDEIDGEHVNTRGNHARGANDRVVNDLPSSHSSQHSKRLVHFHLLFPSPTAAAAASYSQID